MISGSAAVVETRAVSLVEVLDRVLDKGLVVAGDIRVSLANVELLTIQIRLLVCSIDKAEQIGLNWWRYDSALTRGSTTERAADQEDLRERIAALEQQIKKLTAALGQQPQPSRPRRTGK